jgi:hypothetical protein
LSVKFSLSYPVLALAVRVLRVLEDVLDKIELRLGLCLRASRNGNGSGKWFWLEL